jgi:glycosyltransferase involved in cell wall biosynthesis
MIYNGSPIPPFDESAPREKQVIWVNNLKRWKRPEVLVRLAHRLPEWQFLMIGRMAEGNYGRWIASLIAQGPPNLHYLGPKSVDEVNEEIARSSLLLYTSQPVEGFGNSFLQAWLRGAPTVSLSFDLDGIPEREGIGRCARTFDELVDVVDELMRNDDLRSSMGRHARAYAVRHHAVDRMVNEYEALFTSIVEGRPIAVESGVGQHVASG